MIHPLLLISVVCGVIFILYLILTYEKDKRGLKNTEQTTWDDSMENLYNEVVDEINRPVVDSGWIITTDCTVKDKFDLPTLTARYYDKGNNKYYFRSSDYSEDGSWGWWELIGKVPSAYFGDMWFANEVWKGNMKLQHPDLCFRELSEGGQVTINLKYLFDKVSSEHTKGDGAKGSKGSKGDREEYWSGDIQRDCTGKAVYGRVPVGSSIPVGSQTKASLLLRLFGKNFQSKSKSDKEHWVKLYDKGSECTSNTEYVSGSEFYISSKGFMVTVNNSENSSKDKPKFYFDLVKDGDDVNTPLLTVEENFHKLSYIVSAIMKGGFKPSDSPYDKYWLELERVKVNEVLSDHQKVKGFFDKLDQRWYEYSVMYNDAMGGVIGFTPYDSKLSVGSGDELQKVIEKMGLNSNLESLLSVVEDDKTVKSVILDRYNVEVSVDRSEI